MPRLFNCHWNSISDGYKSTSNSGFGFSRAICAGGFHQHNPVGFIRRGVGSSSCNIGMADIKNSFKGSVMGFWDFADKHPIVLVVIAGIVVGGIAGVIEALRKQ